MVGGVGKLRGGRYIHIYIYCTYYFKGKNQEHSEEDANNHKFVKILRVV